MLSPRWRKTVRDLAQEKGRTLMMVAAIAVSVFGVGTILGGYSILTREIRRNYMDTHPATATLRLETADRALADRVRAFPRIADAEPRATIQARVRVGSDWLRMLLFVIDDFDALRLNTFRPTGGAWPPPTGTMLVERVAAKVLQAGPGHNVLVKTPHGTPRQVPISGLVHDPALAPATQERTGYGYITTSTLTSLGETGGLDELRVLATGPLNRREGTVLELAKWLEKQGRHVEEIRVPPGEKHPHEGQMKALLFMMLAFTGMALALSAIMVSSTVAALMARQIREIGVMKAVGARTHQIAGMYAAMVAVLGAAATVVAMPLSTLAARVFATKIAGLLNFDIGSSSIPWWVWFLQISAGVLIPLLFASLPILRGSRITVREAINDYGVSPEVAIPGWIGVSSRSLSMALRNSLRHRRRTALTLGLLAAGGAMFLAALNTAQAWRREIAEVYLRRHYDVEVRLNRAEAVDTFLPLLRGIPGVRKVEAWGFAPVAFAREGVADVVRTYPDGGHGSFLMLAPPASTSMVDYPVIAGRWLEKGDTDAVVLNRLAVAQAPGIQVGSRIALSVGGRPTTWRVAGIVEEIGSPAAAYVTDASFARAADLPGRAAMFRIATESRNPEARLGTIRSVERELQAAGMSIAVAIPLAELRTAMGEHILVLISSLVAMAALMAVVGALGLTSAMSISVVERTREFGVMRAIGAGPSQVRSIVMAEGVFIGALSWLAAGGLGVGLSALVGRQVGMLAFKVTLPLVMSPVALLAWLGIVVVLSAAATAVPAWRASRLPVTEALASL